MFVIEQIRRLRRKRDKGHAAKVPDLENIQG